jgi:hypothetical protein
MDPHIPPYRTPIPKAYPSAQPRSAQSIISWDALCNLPSSSPSPNLLPSDTQADIKTRSRDLQDGPRPASLAPELAHTPEPPSPIPSLWLESLPGPLHAIEKDPQKLENFVSLTPLRPLQIYPRISPAASY